MSAPQAQAAHPSQQPAASSQQPVEVQRRAVSSELLSLHSCTNYMMYLGLGFLRLEILVDNANQILSG
jgi:hypothetical protein